MIEFLGEFCFSHKPMINALADYPYTELLHDFKSWCTETQISKLNYRYQRKGYKDLVDCNIVLENFKDIVRYSFEHDMRVEIEKARWISVNLSCLTRVKIYQIILLLIFLKLLSYKFTVP